MKGKFMHIWLMLIYIAAGCGQLAVKNEARKWLARK